MESFKFNCPQCGQHLEAQDEWRGEETQCPSCSAIVKIPVVLQCSPINPQNLAPEERKCPKCGETIKKEAVFCRWCKQHIPPQNFNSYANTPPNADTYGQDSEIVLIERLCGHQAAQTGKFSIEATLCYAVSILFMPMLGWLYLVFGIVLLCKGKTKHSVSLGYMYLVFWIASHFAWVFWVVILSILWLR